MQEFATQSHDGFPENVREYHFYRFSVWITPIVVKQSKTSYFLRLEKNWNTKLIETRIYKEKIIKTSW